ncbi:MAG: pilus assembly protein PilP [Nitrospirales bacterium]
MNSEVGAARSSRRRSGKWRVIVAVTAFVPGWVWAMPPDMSRLVDGGEARLLVAQAPASPAPGGGEEAATPAAPGAQPSPEDAVLVPEGKSSIGKSGDYSYLPGDRRDPFAPIIFDGAMPNREDPSLPPLQRLALSDLSLIGIIWGGFGYSAMLQASDGKGYMVRNGTRVGPNGGVVSSITENEVIIREEFVDVYGKPQVREFVKRLHEEVRLP